MTAVETLRVSAAPLADPGLYAAVEAFLAAHKASQEAWSNLSRAQVSGPDPVPPQAEFLRDEAQHAWDFLATGWAENLIPLRAREAGAEYVRPKSPSSGHVVVPSFGSWQESIGQIDWSRGRGAAA